jgi:signal transduction histidine kinase
VFERLRQADAGKRSGLGLGLAIARHIVELHHGEITAESEGIGKGARFTVTLPLLHASANEERVEAGSLSA